MRIQIEGPIVAIEKLLPGIRWDSDPTRLPFPQPAGQKLADLAYRTLYNQRDLAAPVIRDENLGWVVEKPL